MTDKFIPFTVASHPAASPVFAPHTAPAAPAPSAPQPLTPPPINPGPATPELSLVRDGDRVTMIRVRCTCGMVHEIQCQY